MATTDDISSLTDEALARLAADLGKIVGRLKSYFRQLLKSADLGEDGGLADTKRNAALARRLAVDLAGAIEEAGYEGAVDRVRAAFDRVAEAATAAMEDELGDEYSGVDVAGLARFANGAVDRMLALKDEAGARLREVLLVGIASNLPLDREVADLAEAARISLQDAITETSTALMAYGRAVVTEDAEAAGFDLFLYDGPDDEVNRPFCARNVGKVFTKGDLDGMNNDSKLSPVSEYLGGYNCRHGLQAITLEEAKDLPRSAIAGREAQAIVFRRKVGPAAKAYAAAARRRGAA